MISYLEGDVHAVATNSVTLLTYGVGRLVHVTPALALNTRVGAQLSLHTVLVVREDALTLFGFATAGERDVFEVLTAISGVGPKLALAVLGTLDPGQLGQAVADGDEKALTRVPGIGKKVAGRLLLELGSKLDKLPAAAAPATPGGRSADPGADEVVVALTGLGWKDTEAGEAVAQVRATAPEAGVPALLKASLRLLGGGR